MGRLLQRPVHLCDFLFEGDRHDLPGHETIRRALPLQKGIAVIHESVICVFVRVCVGNRFYKIIYLIPVAIKELFLGKCHPNNDVEYQQAS